MKTERLTENSIGGRGMIDVGVCTCGALGAVLDPAVGGVGRGEGRVGALEVHAHTPVSRPVRGGHCGGGHFGHGKGEGVGHPAMTPYGSFLWKKKQDLKVLGLYAQS